MERSEYNHGIEEKLKQKTRKFALDIVNTVRILPHGLATDVLARQLIRSGTSVGANYRAACRGKSRADMIAKLAIVEEEADEAMYWLDLLLESGAMERIVAESLKVAADEILRLVVTSIKTMRASGREVNLIREELFRYRSSRDEALMPIPIADLQPSNPQLQSPIPNSNLRSPTPISDPQLQTPNPKTPNPKTPNPKPQTPNPKLQTPNSKPQTPNSKLQLQTPNSKLQTKNDCR